MAAAPSAKQAESPQVAISDLGDLHLAWDNDESCRDRMRTFGRLCLDQPAPDQPQQAPKGVVQKTHENVKWNKVQLMPLLQAMKPHVDIGIPEKDKLQNELRMLYAKSGLNPTAQVLSDQAWSLRHLFNLVKNLRYRERPPRESWKDFSINLLIFGENTRVKNLR